MTDTEPRTDSEGRHPAAVPLELAPDSWARAQGSLAVLSVRQPWAWALVTGRKDVENRSWRTHRRGFIAIHAGRRSDRAGFQLCEQMGLEVPPDLPFGAVVGAVELVDVVDDHSSPWASPGGFHWVIRRAFAISPVPMVGRRGIFGAPQAVVEALLHPPSDTREAGRS